MEDTISAVIILLIIFFALGFVANLAEEKSKNIKICTLSQGKWDTDVNLCFINGKLYDPKDLLEQLKAKKEK